MIGASIEQRVLNNVVTQEVAHLRKELSLFTKKFIIVDTKIVNAVGSQGKTPSYDIFYSEEGVKYLDNHVVGF